MTVGMMIICDINSFPPQLLENIDPNPDNFVSAGIIHTRSAQIGCLLRLEPNKQAQVRGARLVWERNNSRGVFRCSDSP